MLEHTALEDRLNAVRNGEEPPERESIYEHSYNEEKEIPTVRETLVTIGIDAAFIGTSSFLYGYGLKGIFETDWNVLSTFGVGYIMYMVFDGVKNIIQRATS